MIKYLALIFIISITSIAQTNIQKGQTLIDEKKYEDAERYYSNLLENEPDNDSIYYQLALVNLALNDIDEATDMAEKAVELKPNDAGYHFRLGQVYGRDAQQASIFRQPGLAGDVKDEFEKAVELDSNLIGARVGLIQFHMNAPGIVGGDIDEAIKNAKFLKTKDERLGSYFLASIYSSEEQFEKADKEFKLLDAKYGNDKDFFYLHNGYGYYLLNRERVDEAIVQFKKQVELAPDRANSYDSLGEGLRRKGDLSSALKAYKKAVELNPKLESSVDAIEEIEDELGL